LIQFGVKTGQNGLSFEKIAHIWRRAEKVGFDSAWLYDHFYSMREKNQDCLECWTTLSALATVTKRVRIGSNVTCNSFRYPSVLAKMVSTVDVISKGRVEIAIGAGWYEEEHVAYGIPFPSAPERVARLAESVLILKKMFTEDKANFKGKYYKVKDALNYPKPVQKPNPPIYIGIAKGTKVLPRIVADYADGVNLGTGDRARMKAILDAIRHRCEKVGRDYNNILISWEGSVLLGKDSDTFESKLKMLANQKKTDVEKLRQELLSAGTLMGNPDEVIAGINDYVKLGVQHFILHLDLGDYRTDEPVETFAKYVIPYFKHSGKG